MAVPQILHVFSTFKVGGPQIRFAALARGWGRDFSHTVIAMDADYAAAAELPSGPDIAIGERPSTGGPLPARLGRYRRYLKEKAPDLLITYNWGAIEWAMAKHGLGLPHIHVEDGFGPEEAQRQLRRRVWTRRLMLRHSEVIVPSLTLKNLALDVWRLDPARVHYIPNGIEPKDDYATRLETLGLDLPVGRPRIAWAGALRREKNPVRMVRAFAPFKNEAVLLIIGEGPERDAVHREIERLSLGPSVRLLGKRADVRDLLMQCDIMALSSDTEQMPLAVLEGMDAGLAIAATNVGDVKHMVGAMNRAHIAVPSDRALGEALGALLADAPLRARIGAENRDRLRQMFPATVMIAGYRNQMSKSISAGRRARASSGA